MGTVYVDALATQQFAGNVDPNVFSDALPWFHAYCLIEKRDEKRILPSGAILSEAAKPGDIIIYGGPLSRHIIFVDTILCVSNLPTLPQYDGTFALESEFAAFRASARLAQSTGWSDFAQTSSYRANLVDSMPGRRHHRAHIDPHRIIVGTRRKENGKVDAEALFQAFTRGDGFNCIPLAAVQASTRKSVKSRPGLFVIPYCDASSLIKSGVNVLPSADGRRLLHQIFSSADRLVLDPLVRVAV